MGVVGLEMCTRYRFLIIITQEATIEKRPPFISPQFLVSSYINIKHKVERRCAVVGCSFLMDFCFYFIFFRLLIGNQRFRLSPFCIIIIAVGTCIYPVVRLHRDENEEWTTTTTTRIEYIFFSFLFLTYSREGKKLFFRQHKSPLYTQ